MEKWTNFEFGKKEVIADLSLKPIRKLKTKMYHFK